MRKPAHTGLFLAEWMLSVVSVMGAVVFAGLEQTAVGQTATISASAAERVTEAEPQALPSTTPLAITVTPAPVPKGQMPEFVTMTLTNTSDHEVRFPQPGIGCTDALNGTIELVVTPAAAEVSSCNTEAPVGTPVEKWMTLRPGETANFGERVTQMLPKGPGTFEVKAVYTPPMISPGEQEKLYRESVTYPAEALTSAAVMLVRDP
jgi:hypothetical protein